MKKITLSICTLALLSQMGWAQTLDRSIRPKAGPAPEVKIGKTETFTLPNGMKVFVVENHKLPVVEYSIQLDIHPELEGDMAGFQDLMSELLTSGTKTRSKDKLNEEIDFLGANIDANAKGLSGSSLKKHQQKLLELMSDVLMNADFKQTELDNLKKRSLSGLESEKNNPDAMLKNAAAAITYGNNHPYGEIATDATVAKVTLERCKKYYSTYFRPNVAYMAIVGDITVAEVKPLIEKYFGGWKKAEVPVAKYPVPTAPASTKVAFVPREGAVQSVINVTYPVNLQVGTEDAIKARVTNAILGDGSQGRLFLNLREKHGWTYGSYSSLSADELVGNFTAYAKCRNIVSDSSVAEIIAEMKRMQTEKVDKETLQNTINYLSGGFAIGLEDPSRIAQFAINTDRLHLPKDYYANYLKTLAAVTPEDVQTTAAKYITPDNANIVVVGNKDEVAKKLAVFAKDGQVSYFDNYGRPVKATETKAVAAGVTAEIVYNKYIAAIGGEKAINGLKDVTVKYEGSLQGQKLSVTRMTKSPDKMKMEFSVMGQSQQMILNGDKAFAKAGPQKQDLPAEMVAEMKPEADLQSNLHADKYGIKRTLKGMEKLNEKDVYVLEAVNAKGDKTVEYYEVATGFKVKTVETSEQGSQIVEYGDYQEVPGSNGFKIPGTLTVPLGPGMSVPTKLLSVDVNKGIADSEFQ